jgi:hypothetical protein
MNWIDSPFVDIRVSWQPAPRRSSSRPSARLPALLSLVLIALILNGCGSADRSHGYADQPPSNRTAFVAWEEWTRFGRSTIVYGGHAGGYINRAGMSEHSEPLSSRVGDYWGTCGHPEWNGRTSGRPWSGAFVSWVMAHSGVPASAFPRDGRHGQYLATLYDHQRAGHASFLLHAPNEYAPKQGDLVCSGTAGPTWRFADSRTARRRIDYTASHCDVVTGVHGGLIQAIGGNVKDSVTMSLYPADSRGRLAPTPGKIWMMVVENRAT